MYKKYKKEVEQSELDANTKKEMKVQIKTYSPQTLSDKHFRIIEKNEDKVHVACKYCKLVLKGSLSNRAYFQRHLTVISIFEFKIVL